MKKKGVLLVIVVLAFLSESTKGQLFLRGYIHDENHNQIVLFEPINGFYNQDFPGPNSAIQTSGVGYFEKEIGLANPSMFCLNIGVRRIYFFAQPGDTISVTVDTNKFSDILPDGAIAFKGNNSAGNEYFNSFNWQPGKKFGAFEKIADDSLHFRDDYDFNSTDLALNRVTSVFDTLLHKNLITQTYYDLVVGGIKDILITTEIRYLIVGQNTIPFHKAIEIANGIYKRYPVTPNRIKQTNFGNSIAYYYYKTLAAKNYSSERLADSTLVVNGKNLFVNSNFVYWLYAPKDMQEILWAKSLIDLKNLFATDFGKRDVDVFLDLHPDSPIKRYLLYSFRESETSLTSLDSSLIIHVADTTSKKLSDFIKTNFSGEKLYVDLWASWCVPCKQEFAFARVVDSFCRKNQIKILYISIDELNMKSSMLKNIYAYNLKGFHIRASKELYSSIEKTIYSGNEVFTIPRYLLVNEEGIVVNPDAPRPSSGNELFNVMKKDFKIKTEIDSAHP